MRMQDIFNQLSRKIGLIRFKGNRYYCPICRSGYSRFLPMGRPPRAAARCPGCGSLERHRLLLAALEYLRNRGTIKSGGRISHFAPEACLSKIFSASYDYVSVDFYAKEVKVRTDITALCFADGCFDAIVCNHVLEQWNPARCKRRLKSVPYCLT
jgi:hypothetical protein